MRKRPHPLMKLGARVVLAATGALLLALPLGCFSLKEPACAFTCTQPPHACPASYTCGDDGLCHRDGTDGSCPVTAPEAGAGSSAGDATDAGATPDR